MGSVIFYIMKKLTIFTLFFLLFQLTVQASTIALEKKEFYQNSISDVKTTIKITYPNSKTIWTAPGVVKLEWITKNIPENKTIKFYLSKDDMVVQELGVFENASFKYEIKLDRGLQEGNNYRVIGIELFPDNKYSIAKYATSLFTIKKAPRKKKDTIAVSNVASMEEVAPIKNVIPKKETSQLRDNFNGRNINYVNTINVNSEEITISLWDHGRKDGDVVSIYLNGVAVVSKYLLQYQKKIFHIKLDTSKANDLFLYAHNLGKFPPNTVSIEIKDGEIAENIVLNSDLKNCEAVMINVKK